MGDRGTEVRWRWQMGGAGGSDGGWGDTGSGTRQAHGSGGDYRGCGWMRDGCGCGWMAMSIGLCLGRALASARNGRHGVDVLVPSLAGM